MTQNGGTKSVDGTGVFVRSLDNNTLLIRGAQIRVIFLNHHIGYSR